MFKHFCTGALIFSVLVALLAKSFPLVLGGAIGVVIFIALLAIKS